MNVMMHITVRHVRGPPVEPSHIGATVEARLLSVSSGKHNSSATKSSYGVMLLCWKKL